MDPFIQLFMRSVKKNSKKLSQKKKKNSTRKKTVKRIGSKAEVIHGNAIQTQEGLTKDELTYNKNGSIVSKKRSTNGHRIYNKK